MLAATYLSTSIQYFLPTKALATPGLFFLFIYLLFCLLYTSDAADDYLTV